MPFVVVGGSSKIHSNNFLFLFLQNNMIRFYGILFLTMTGILSVSSSLSEKEDFSSFDPTREGADYPLAEEATTTHHLISKNDIR